MTRSRKKSPFFGISTSVSEKADKVAAHKRERRKVRTVMKVDPEAEPLPHTREISNIWAFAKDGPKRYRKNVNPAKMRK